jgi:DNA gyrase subunit B
MPSLIEQGHLYIAQPPLFKAEKGRSISYLKDESARDAYLIEEGASGATLLLAAGAQIAGEDLLRLAREAASVKLSIDRLTQRAPAQILEQAALAGALSPEAGDAQAAQTAKRLDVIADEGEGGWTGAFGADHALVLERIVRGVTERVVLDRALLSSADARRLADRAGALNETYAGRAVLRRAGQDLPVTGPLSLLSAIKAAGGKGVTLSRYKGLGEMNAEQLWETTLDMDARSLLQVKVEHADTADEMFSQLMGDVVEPRREFIQANALDAQVDA